MVWTRDSGGVTMGVRIVLISWVELQVSHLVLRGKIEADVKQEAV